MRSNRDENLMTIKKNDEGKEEKEDEDGVNEER